MNKKWYGELYWKNINLYYSAIMYVCVFKRMVDVFFALAVLVILLPFFLIVVILLYFVNKGSGVFFVQERPGKNSDIFKIIKLKTMTDERDVEGKLLPDAERLTRIGRFIRSISIDEFPQLINVLKGDMSFIGPRPLLPVYLAYYTREQARRHEVRPGITGWAQVHGRNLMRLSKKFEYDVWYVDHVSFYLDLKIIFLTVVNILQRKDVGEGSSTMTEVDDLHIAERIKASKYNQ